MKRSKLQWTLSIALAVLTLVTASVGALGYGMRPGEYVAERLEDMRAYSVLHAAASSIIDEIAREAKREAKDWATAENPQTGEPNIKGRDNQREYYNGVEAEARAEAEATYASFEGMDLTPLSEAIPRMEAAEIAYYDLEAVEKAAYAEVYLPAREKAAALAAELAAEPDAEARAEEFVAEALESARAAYTERYGSLSAEAEEGFRKVFAKLYAAETQAAREALEALEAQAEAAVPEEDAVEEQSVAVDYSGFAGSSALARLEEAIDAEYGALWSAVTKVLPNLTEEMREDQKAAVEAAVYAPGETFEARYARLASANGENALKSGDRLKMGVASNASNLTLGAIAMLVITLVAFFYQALIKKLGVPRLIIGVFFIMLLLLSGLYGLNMSSMMSNVLKRTGQYGILVLAMLPGIQCGISLNMGMTVGIVAGLLSTLLALEMNMTGWSAFAFAVAVGAVLAAPIGWAYSKLLNRLKGNEMTVSTYVGFSFVSLMSIFWMILPFRNPKLTWALGTGLRVMHTMSGNIGGLLNSFLSFRVLGVTVPTGLILFLLLCCGALWLFSRSRTGTAMVAAGSNPRFAEAAGINVDKMRTIGTTLSTVIAAVGIIVYSQSFGFMQLYSGPRQMGFTAASAILIGGASTSRAKVSHVIIGTFLFQGVLSMGILVANQAISANGLSEVMRILISNGIILYALTQSGGEDNA